MHTAAVVDDALVLDLSPERFLPVMGPKIAGTWNLHEATLNENLDFFILFSSIAAVHPQPGMGSYAAANAFLDSFAQYRRALGKPAISVNWGGWNQIGLARAAGTGRSIEGYEQQGMPNFSGQEALAALGRALVINPVQVIAVPFDWTRFAEFHSPGDVPSAFAEMVARTNATASAETSRSEILEQLGGADSSEAAAGNSRSLSAGSSRPRAQAGHPQDRPRTAAREHGARLSNGPGICAAAEQRAADCGSGNGGFQLSDGQTAGYPPAAQVADGTCREAGSQDRRVRQTGHAERPLWDRGRRFRRASRHIRRRGIAGPDGQWTEEFLMTAEANPRISPAKLALAVRRLRAEKENLDLIASDPIAIIGMGCRFPGGAASPDEFWTALKEGRDCIRRNSRRALERRGDAAGAAASRRIYCGD